MIFANTPERYGIVAQALHWLIAAALILNICLGLYMAEVLANHDPMRLVILQLHKSIGLTVLALSIARLLWRLAHPVPPLPASMPPNLKLAAHLSHFFLYVLIILIPLSGWALASSGRSNAPTNYFGLFHWPNLPYLASLTKAERISLHHGSNVTHVALAISAIVLVPIHIAAAFYHHRRGDDVLRRMLPWSRIAVAK